MRNALAKIFHKTAGRLISIVRELTSSLSDCNDGKYFVAPNPPYISQFANAKRQKVDGYYQSIHDSSASRRFGAKSLEEFSYWAWRSCGIAGVQMVLKAQLGKSFAKSTMELVNEALSLEGYDTKTDVGWYHDSLVKLAKNYKVEARLVKFVAPTQVAKLILEGNYVLASIKSKSGGHLLLIHGVIIKGGNLKSFIVHDPYNFTEDGEEKEVSKATFESLSTRRIIVFKNKEGKNAQANRV